MSEGDRLVSDSFPISSSSSSSSTSGSSNVEGKVGNFNNGMGGMVNPPPRKPGIIERSYNNQNTKGRIRAIGRTAWREYVGTIIGFAIVTLFLIFIASQIWWYESADSAEKDVANFSPIAWQAAIIGDWLQLIILIVVLVLIVTWHRKHHSEHKLPLDAALHKLKKAKQLVIEEFNHIAGGAPPEVQSEMTHLDSIISTLGTIQPWLSEASHGTKKPFPIDSHSSPSHSRTSEHLVLISNLHRAKETILTESLHLNTILEHLYYGISSDQTDPDSDFQVLIQISTNPNTTKADSPSIRSLEKARWHLLLQQDLLHVVIQECQHIEVDKLRGEQREAKRAIESHEYETFRALKTLRVKHHSGGSTARPSSEPLESGGQEGTSGGQLLFLLLAGGTAIYMLSLVVKWWVGDKNPAEEWNFFMKILATVFPFHVLLLYSTVEYFTNVNPYSKMMPPKLKWTYKVFLQYLVWWNLTWAFIAIALDYHSGFNTLLDSLGLASTIDFRLHVVAHLGELAAMKWFAKGKKGPARVMKFILRMGDRFTRFMYR